MLIRYVALLSMCALAFAAAAQEEAMSKDTRMGWWREARFGLFIHWGLYAIPAGEWNGRTNHAEWIRETAHIPIDTYNQFVRQFNPVKFDANEWVRMAKDAGMKYVVITSKHHDGFCLFDSKYTDFDVMSTPFHRDILKELADACRREGLKMCWYHSIMDWHHPDYLPRRSWETRSAEGADFKQYVEHLRNQVTELLTNYGEIGVMWFDGEWEGTWTHEYGGPLYDLCRKLQPNVIVNNRVDKGRGGMGGMSDEGFAGDFGTPEQYIPDTGIPGVDWETCMTMNDHWGYNKNDTNWKSGEDLIRKLVDIASKGGNFLLNVGPKADGTFPEESVQRLKEMGAWMRVYGESIYGTQASPLGMMPWGRCTSKQAPDGTVLYLHVFDWPADGKLVVPGLGNEVERCALMGSNALTVSREEGDIVIDVPKDAPNAICSVVVLEVTGKPIIYRMPEISAPAEILVRPMLIRMSSSSDELEIRYTLDGSDPDVSSRKYTAPFSIEDNTVVKARAFHNDMPVSRVATKRFEKVGPAPPFNVPGLTTGLHCDVFNGQWDKLPDFGERVPEQTVTVDAVTLPSGPAIEYVARRFAGYIEITDDDVYLFALTSDDGSRLIIDGNIVVDNDGLHAAVTKMGAMALAKGTHAIVVEYFNKTGDQALRLEYAPAGEALRPVPASRLKHRPQQP